MAGERERKQVGPFVMSCCARHVGTGAFCENCYYIRHADTLKRATDAEVFDLLEADAAELAELDAHVDRMQMEQGRTCAIIASQDDVLAAMRVSLIRACNACQGLIAAIDATRNEAKDKGEG